MIVILNVFVSLLKIVMSCSLTYWFVGILIFIACFGLIYNRLVSL